MWLALPEPLPAGPRQEDPEPSDDLAALGRIARAWPAVPSAKRPGTKPRPLAEPLQAILQRLHTATPGQRYPSAAALPEDLDWVSADVPPNPEAWDRLAQVAGHHSAGKYGEPAVPFAT